VKFEDRYKKIKFIEKRKVLRLMEKAKKEGREAGFELNNQLKYINNFPMHWKYVSIFGGTEGQSSENLD
jgi:hypothetical protein